MKKPKFNIPRCKDMKGFSLIEVIMAMGIMSVGLLAVAAMQISTVRNNRTGNTFTQATALARAQMEVIKNGDINDITDPLNPSTFPGTTQETGIDENGDAGGIYTRSWTIAPYLVDIDGDGTNDALVDIDGDGTNDASSTFARMVTVTVTFPFVGSGIRQVSLSSVTTGGGL